MKYKRPPLMVTGRLDGIPIRPWPAIAWRLARAAKRLNKAARPSRSPRTFGIMLIASLCVTWLSQNYLWSVVQPPALYTKLDWFDGQTRIVIVSDDTDIYVDGNTITVTAAAHTNSFIVLCSVGLRTDVVIPTNHWAEFLVSQNLLTWTPTKVHVMGYGTNFSFYAPFEGQFQFYRVKFTPI
jgi:hypothetical protein